MPTVALKDLPRVYSRHEVKALAAVRRGLMAGALAGRAHLVRVTPKDRGMAKAAWKTYRGSPESGIVATNQNSAPYIGILEKGARPHKVSLIGQRAIYEWVERHFRIAGGIVLSGRDMAAGIKSDTLTNTKSQAHKAQRMGYLDRLSKLGAMLEANLVRNFPEMGKRLVPAALNIAAAIIQRIRKHGAKPHYFTRDALPMLARIAQGEVARLLKELAALEVK